MFTEGTLLFFNLFEFRNNNPSKPKYFLVLAATPTHTVLATLPSSQDYVPASVQPLRHGCIELPQATFNCYVFLSKTPVTTNGWAFPKNTFLYGQQLDEFEIAVLTDIYPVEGVDYEIIGTLTNQEFEQVRQCFIQSAFVKRKFKRMLGGEL